MDESAPLENGSSVCGSQLPDHNQMQVVDSYKELVPLTYPYMDRSKKSIRLLSFIHNTEQPDLIRCTLSTHSISDCPRYVALSYTWGDPLHCRDIELNNQPFKVRENLYAALSVLRKFVLDTEAWTHNISRKARFPWGPAWRGDQLGNHFWIDAICINQCDLQERSHQVGMMNVIFPTADFVVVWLGPPAEDSDFVMDLLARGHTLDGQGSSHPRLGSPRDERRAVVRLLSRPYWERMWVIQECTLAQDLVLLCGDHGCWWDSLTDFCMWLDKRYPNHTQLLEQQPSLIMPVLGLIRHRRNYRLLIINEDYNDKFVATSIPDLLRMSQYGKCQDLRDKIYAILAIAYTNRRNYRLMGFVGPGNHPPRGCRRYGLEWPPLAADYTISPIHLFYRVLAHENELYRHLNTVGGSPLLEPLRAALQVTPQQEVDFLHSVRQAVIETIYIRAEELFESRGKLDPVLLRTCISHTILDRIDDAFQGGFKQSNSDDKDIFSCIFRKTSPLLGLSVEEEDENMALWAVSRETRR